MVRLRRCATTVPGAGLLDAGWTPHTGRRRSVAAVTAAFATAAAAVLIGICSAPSAARRCTPPVPRWRFGVGRGSKLHGRPPTDSPRVRLRRRPGAAGAARRRPASTVVHPLSGATTVTMLDGHCHHPEGTQRAAEAFLRGITLDRYRGPGVQRPAVLLATPVHRMRPAVRGRSPRSTSSWSRSRRDQGVAVAPSGAIVVGVGHYDPLPGRLRQGDGRPGLSAASSRRDGAARRDVAAWTTDQPVCPWPTSLPSRVTDHDPVTRPGLGTVPDDVARTCALTWMCDPPPFGPNPHPDDAGYRTIAAAIAEAVAGAPTGRTPVPDRRPSQPAARPYGDPLRSPAPWRRATGHGSGRSRAWPSACAPTAPSTRCTPRRRAPR